MPTRKPSKPAARKGSSRKPAAKAAVRKSRAKPVIDSRTPGERALDRLSDFSRLSPEVEARWRAERLQGLAPGVLTGSALTGREAAIEGPAQPPRLNIDEIDAAVRMATCTGLSLDDAIDKVRSLRYGYQPQDFGVIDGAASDCVGSGWDALHNVSNAAIKQAGDLIDQINQSAESAANLSASVWGHGILPPTPQMTLQDELRLVLDKVDMIGSQLDGVVERLYPVLRMGLMPYSASLTQTGPDSVKEATAPISPAALRARAAQRQIGVISALLDAINEHLDLPTLPLNPPK